MLSSEIGMNSMNEHSNHIEAEKSILEIFKDDYSIYAVSIFRDKRQFT